MLPLIVCFACVALCSYAAVNPSSSGFSHIQSLSNVNHICIHTISYQSQKGCIPLGQLSRNMPQLIQPQALQWVACRIATGGQSPLSWLAQLLAIYPSASVVAMPQSPQKFALRVPWWNLANVCKSGGELGQIILSWFIWCGPWDCDFISPPSPALSSHFLATLTISPNVPVRMQRGHWSNPTKAPALQQPPQARTTPWRKCKRQSILMCKF